jgi:hypothetical protein
MFFLILPLLLLDAVVDLLAVLDLSSFLFIPRPTLLS